jgi:hypothetical protein
MIVECKRIVNHISGLREENSPWISVSKQYTVLEIVSSGRGPAQFRIVCDDGRTPGLQDCRQFDTVSADIPPEWIAETNERGLTVGPKEFLRGGFWEDFFDQRPEAVRQFADVYKRLDSLRDAGVPRHGGAVTDPASVGGAVIDSKVQLF